MTAGKSWGTIISSYVIKGQLFEAGRLEPGLYLAATPIGNLGDITLRVLEALAGADLIACEDTRVTGKLLRHFGIKVKTVSYHEHNAEEAGPKLLADVKSGKAVVLVSDAGTPIVSDPGSRIVADARREGLSVVPLPGASAPLAALVASGVPGEAWTFRGFLPPKQGARKTTLETCANSSETQIFFESPNRLEKTLTDMMAALGPDRMICVARELTKLHEEITTASVQDMIAHYDGRAIKGEIVILISPASADEAMDVDRLLSELLENMSVSKAAAEAASLTAQSKRDLYQRALELKERQQE